MKRQVVFLLFLICLDTPFAQEANQTELFASRKAMNLKLKISFDELKDKTNDSTYMDGILHYEINGIWDSIDVKLKKRGQFRLKRCFFTPIKLKIKKKKAKGTPFEGNKKLKLVFPCERSPENNALVIRELICYQIYEQVTPYSFRTRLVNIELLETTKKTDRLFKIKGFLIEDDDKVAGRHQGIIRKNLNPHPLLLMDTVETQHAMFQYLISNLDWSTTNQHNSKIMVLTDSITYIPLAYDFDLSGLVDARYAVVDEQFETDDVKDRIFRGFCHENPDLIYLTREHFLRLESKIVEIMAAYSSAMSQYEYHKMTSFVSTFYDTLRDEDAFKRKIADRCRTK